MCIRAALIVLATVLEASPALGQWDPSVVRKDDASEDGESSIVVIDSPPAPSPPDAPPSRLVLERPGQVLLSGTPVRVQFRSPTDGVSFQLRVGGSYSSISGVSFGAGWGWGWGHPGWGSWGYPAWGYPGWGWGGVAPYYGEVITKTYQPICEAPCNATLLSGRHRLALSLGGGQPVDVGRPIDLTVDSVVEGRYVDKRRLRKAGWATFVAGSVAGMAFMFASVDYRNDPFQGDQLRYPAMFYTGLGVFLSSIIAGAVLAAQDDEAYIDVYPLE